MEDELMARGTGEVFSDHLQQGAHRTVDEDLERNYASGVVGAGVVGADRSACTVATKASANWPSCCVNSCRRRNSPTRHLLSPGRSLC